MGLIVIEHPDLHKARAVIDEVSLQEFADVGWVEVGPASHEPGSTLTAEEWAEENEAPKVARKKTTHTKKESE
jgi:hypothetical protein